MFALVDCNNFYVSCERVFNLKLHHKPVVVHSGANGCVIARSNEAKALGIPMGAPLFKHRQLIDTHNVICFASNFALYGDMSKRVMSTLKLFTHQMHIYSIDEAFLYLENTNCEQTGRNIRKTVLQWTGIPTSVGIAPTKTLAKVAAHLAKKQDQYHGVCVLDTPQKITKALEMFPVQEIWGIGRQLSKTLIYNQIQTADDFRRQDDAWIRKKMGVVTLRVAMELRGVSCLPLEEAPSPKKSICTSRTFDAPTTSLTFLKEALSSYVARAAEKLRDQDSLAAVMTVFAVQHPFELKATTHQTISLREPTDYTPHLIQQAKASLSKLYKKDTLYRKVGVILDHLTPSSCCQLDLFTENSKERSKQSQVMRLMDNINEKFGHTVIKTAAEGVFSSTSKRKESITNRFTTDWEELLIVH